MEFTTRSWGTPPRLMATLAGPALASGLGAGHGRRGEMAVAVRGSGRGAPLAMNREIGDARMLAAHRALGIPAQLDFAEAHAERIVGQEPPDEGLADPEQELDGLGRLRHTDHAWEHAQDSGLASGGHEARRRRRGIEAAVAGALVRGEDRRHALELEDRAVDIGLAGQ